MTADDAIVVSHDTALNPAHTRDADGAWLPATGARIRTLTLAQLQHYDVGRIQPGTAYAKQFAGQVPRDGERIPTLAAVFAPPEIRVRALLDEIGKACMTQRVTIQSFDWRTLALVGELAPGMPRATSRAHAAG